MECALTVHNKQLKVTHISGNVLCFQIYLLTFIQSIVMFSYVQNLENKRRNVPHIITAFQLTAW